MKREKMNILFVCRYNRFRSRVAEAYFNKISKNKRSKAKSAGLVIGNPPLSKLSINAAKSLGLNIKGKPRGLSSKLLKWQDVTVIVADDVPKAVFMYNKKYGKKLIVWKIADIKRKDRTNIEKIKIMKKILKKVDKLVKSMEKK